MAKKKSSSRKSTTGRKKTTSTSSAKKRTASSTSGRRKDPKGGLTSAGRKYFAKKQGAHLKPGVTGAADTPEKMKRKGSFLRRHFAKPRGPMQKDGKPTRLALSAHAWGEPVPKTLSDARKLAAKGSKLLARYQRAQKSGSSSTRSASSSRR